MLCYLAWTGGGGVFGAVDAVFGARGAIVDGYVGGYTLREWSNPPHQGGPEPERLPDSVELACQFDREVVEPPGRVPEGGELVYRGFATGDHPPQTARQDPRRREGVLTPDHQDAVPGHPYHLGRRRDVGLGRDPAARDAGRGRPDQRWAIRGRRQAGLEAVRASSSSGATLRWSVRDQLRGQCLRTGSK